MAKEKLVEEALCTAISSAVLNDLKSFDAVVKLPVGTKLTDEQRTVLFDAGRVISRTLADAKKPFKDELTGTYRSGERKEIVDSYEKLDEHLRSALKESNLDPNLMAELKEFAERRLADVNTNIVGCLASASKPANRR